MRGYRIHNGFSAESPPALERDTQNRPCRLCLNVTLKPNAHAIYMKKLAHPNKEFERLFAVFVVAVN